MKQIEKDKLTRQSVETMISRIIGELAKFMEDHIGEDGVSLNTQGLHQKIGALRALREVLFK